MVSWKISRSVGDHEILRLFFGAQRLMGSKYLNVTVEIQTFQKMMSRHMSCQGQWGTNEDANEHLRMFFFFFFRMCLR